ncbi:hypothetical protein P3T35_000485 [Kitasatospora sp. GP30]|nr:hypothetical protein [Kitasatospora sp. GP30]
MREHASHFRVLSSAKVVVPLLQAPDEPPVLALDPSMRRHFAALAVGLWLLACLGYAEFGQLVL